MDSFVVIERRRSGNGNTHLDVCHRGAEVVHRSVARYGIAGAMNETQAECGWTQGAHSKLICCTMTVSLRAPESPRRLWPLYTRSTVKGWHSINWWIGLIRGRPLP